MESTIYQAVFQTTFLKNGGKNVGKQRKDKNYIYERHAY